MTPKEFVNKYNGTATDVDHAYNVQCVDLFKLFTKVNYGISNYNCTNGLASGLWIYRKSKPYYKYFVDANVNNLQNGDWVIWGKCKVAPNSHIAMYYNGKFFGQNQFGVKKARLSDITTAGVIGVLRPKMYIKQPVNNKKYVNLPSNIDKWGFYSVNESPIKKNINGYLLPKKYGGLTYIVRGYKDGNSCVVINTKAFGTVKIYIRGTVATITDSPKYNVVG